MSTDVLSGLTIGSVGGGNMASAIFAGLVKHGVPDTSLVISEPDPARQAHLREQFPGIRLAPNATALATHCDIVLLAVKPQVMPAVLAELRASAATPLYVSIAAGITLATLGRHLPAGAPIVRSMPNLGATLGRSVTGLLANTACTEVERDCAGAIAGAIGSLFWVTSEQDIDAITAVAGSGPAYLFYLLEMMEAGAHSFGITGDSARRMVLETAAAAVALAALDDTSFGEWRQRVTSPGGTTAAALDHLKRQDVPAAVQDAMRAAYERAAALAAAADEDH